LGGLAAGCPVRQPTLAAIIRADPENAAYGIYEDSSSGIEHGRVS
jgi:hypothetical protein